MNLKSVVLMGYSMGTVIALNLLHKHPELFSKAILIGTGDVLIGQPPFEKIVQGLGKVFDFDTFPDHLPKHVSAYWSFFNELGLDRESMKAFSKAKYPDLSIEEVATIQVPTLIISGENDLVLRQGKQVAKHLVNGEYSEVKNADHFTLAIDPSTHQKAVDYLRKKGLAAASKKQGRIAAEGLVESYIHTGGKIGVMIDPINPDVAGHMPATPSPGLLIYVL